MMNDEYHLVSTAYNANYGDKIHKFITRRREVVKIKLRKKS
jgi:hypothetical protein